LLLGTLGVLLTLGAFAPSASARSFDACWLLGADVGCIRQSITVSSGSTVKMRATADWHAGGRVQLWRADPGERTYRLEARLRFDDEGRVVYRWTAPVTMDCCWRWEFRAIQGHGNVVGTSNRLRNEVFPIDDRSRQALRALR
jgi:hypothetical protein